VAVGLSGGLYGLLAAYIYLVWQGGALRIPQVRASVLQTVGINLVINFMPGVGWRAHFGGAIAGLLLIMILNQRQGQEEVRRNAILALAVLAIISVFEVRRSSDFSNDDVYLMTDMNILTFESEHGMSSYAVKMAKNLDRVYDNDYLEQVFR
jgi:rhomboid protease GluP